MGELGEAIVTRNDDDYSIGPAEDKPSFDSRILKHRFVFYAAGCWGEHLKSANAEEDEGIQRKLVIAELSSREN